MLPAGTRREWRTVVVAVIVVLAVGCARQVTRTMVAPGDIATLDERSPFLKAHLANGGVYVLSSWSVEEDAGAIVGIGELLDVNRVRVDSGDYRLPTDSIVLFETNVEGASGAATALTVMAGVTAVVAGICAASPKTCFGSCPTFYAPGSDGSLSLQAEGFSSSIAPGLEATDVDMLLHSRPTEREYSVRVTNEAFETHVIRHADVLAVPRAEDGSAYVTSDGTFLQAGPARAPVGCSSAGGDCLGTVLSADGDEYFSLADSTDLATKETVELVFEDVPEGPLGLVVVSRQTLMTTFLIYQALAYMGDDAGRWLSQLETGGDDARELAGGIGRALGTIDIATRVPGGDWVQQGSVGETGPIAADTRVAPLTGTADGPLQVRLTMAQGMWRLDQLALVRLGAEVEPVRVLPRAVSRDGVDAPSALAALVDREEPLVTLPGDAYEISYLLPERPERFQLFLEARGYYLEWMRQEWMVEEDPMRAAMMVLNPEGVLRDLAPAFKAIEPEIEHLFWNSRYVR